MGSRRLAWIALIALAGGLAGCGDGERTYIDAQPTRELDAVDGCFDGEDSDGDNLVDCYDPDCALECEPDNRAPSTPSVSIAPASPTTDDDLVCSASSDDPDGDAVSYRYSWVRDGEEHATGDTLSAARTWGYDSWRCVVVPTDGALEGTAAEAEVEVLADDQCTAVSLDPGGAVTVPRFAGQDLAGTDFTVEAWIRLRASYSGLTQPIATSDIRDDGSGWRLAVAGPAGERALAFQLGAGVDRVVAESLGLIPEERWSHLAVSFDHESGELTTWIDGTRVGGGTLSAPLAGTSTGDLMIGADGAAALGGELDELRISTVDRYGVHDFQPRIWFEPDADTLALWHFDEGSGAVAAEVAGGREGQLVGASWTSGSACEALN